MASGDFIEKIPLKIAATVFLSFISFLPVCHLNLESSAAPSKTLRDF